MRKSLVLLIFVLFLVTSVDATTWYFWRYRTHATDCTSITDGRPGDLCYEEDDGTVYVCDTEDGLCNTADEWKLATSSGWISASNYDSLNEAVSDIGSSNKTLLIAEDISINSNLTVPSNITLKFIYPGKVTIPSGKTLTINGAIEAGLWQIFDGDGSVDFETIVKVYPQWFGAKGDGITDDTDAIIATFDAVPDGSTVFFPLGTYILKGADTIEVSKSLNIIFAADAIIDATSSTASPIFRFTGSVGTYYSLGADASKGDRTITVNATLASTLSEGDIIKLSTDDALGGDGTLWNDGRSYYFKGELAEVLSVDGTTVELKNGLCDDYTASGTVVAKVNAISGSLENFRLLGDVAENDIGVEISYSKNYEVKGGEIKGFGNSCLYINNSFHAVVDGFSASVIWRSGLGTSYGINISTSQNVVVQNCNISGGRHAITLGGREPCRYVTITDNILDSDPDSTICCLGTHSNTQYIKITNNIIKNGLGISGIDTEVKGNLITSYNLGPDKLFEYSPEGSNITCNYLDISGNTFYSETTQTIRGIYIRSKVANRVISTLSINNNIFKGTFNAITIQLYNTSGEGFTINNVNINNNNFKLSGNKIPIYIYGYDSSHKITFGQMNIENNVIECAYTSIYITKAIGDSLSIIGNNIHNTETNNSHAINIYSDNTIENIVFSSNVIKNDAAAFYTVHLTADRYIKFTNNILDNFQKYGGAQLSATDILFENNKQYNCSGTISFTGRHFNKILPNGNVFTEGTTAPTSGSWKKGDICWNTSPSSGGTIGWTCVRTGQAAPTWQASTDYAVGDKVVPTSDNTYYYECTVAGTSGSSEPTWPTTVGDTVTDGSVTWECKGTAVLFKEFGNVSS